MLDSSSIAHALRFAAPLVLLIWCFVYVISTESPYQTVLRTLKDEKSVFVDDFLEHEIDGRFDGSGIAQLCANKTWIPNMYMSCNPTPGGIGQVKNAHLTCIRLAIEMGAELILPEIVRRNGQNLKQTTPNGGNGPIQSTPLDYFFDYEHLNRTLSVACPQMKVHRSLNDLYNIPNLLSPVGLGLGELGVARTNGVIDDVPGLAKLIRNYLDSKWPKNRRTTPIRFNLEWTWFNWPTAAEKPVFSANFGRILQIREDARRLAASALFNMQQKFQLNLDPRHGIRQDSFIGIHLRTELDNDNEFPPYETQAAYYLDYINKSSTSLVYMATGATQENITSFIESAREMKVTVVTKRDVVPAEDLGRLDGLTWDQKALVDYEIMLRAGLVAGTSESSFIWNLAMRRRNAYGGWDKLEQTHHTEHIQWLDKYSVVFGNSERGKALMRTIWP